jgi:uncharacterized protein YyaL (SSP411 family)
MPHARVAPAIAWSDWTNAGTRARELDCPVLLLLETHWSRASLALAAALESPVTDATTPIGVIAVKADAERRPDLADRYGFGEWPSAAFLTPAGRLFAGGAPESPAELFELLGKVGEAWRTRRPEIERCQNDAAPDAVDSPEPHEPSLDEIRLLVARQDAGAHTAIDWIIDTLIDPDDGGVRRRAGAAEKLLMTNADVLDLLVQAAAAFGESRHVEAVRGVARFVTSNLTRVDGAYKASAAGDSTLLTDASAAMVSSMVGAGAVLEEPVLAEAAIAALERTVLVSYKPGDGVGHVAEDPSVRGLLTDHVRLAEALLDAHEASARIPYGMLAEELLHHCCRVMWDEPGGGFFDRADPADPLKPFELNCRAARVLARAAAQSGEPIFEDRAQATLAALQAGPRPRGAEAAALALALMGRGASGPRL